MTVPPVTAAATTGAAPRVELLAWVLLGAALRVELESPVRESVVGVDSLPLGVGLLLLGADSVLGPESGFVPE